MPEQTLRITVEIELRGADYRATRQFSTLTSPRHVNGLKLHPQDLFPIRGEQRTLAEPVDILLAYRGDNKLADFDFFFDERGQFDLGVYLYQQLFQRLCAEERTALEKAERVDLVVVTRDPDIARLPWVLLVRDDRFVVTGSWTVALARKASALSQTVELPPSPKVLIVAPNPQTAEFPDTEAESHLEELEASLRGRDPLLARQPAAGGHDVERTATVARPVAGGDLLLRARGRQPGHGAPGVWARRGRSGRDPRGGVRALPATGRVIAVGRVHQLLPRGCRRGPGRGRATGRPVSGGGDEPDRRLHQTGSRPGQAIPRTNGVVRRGAARGGRGTVRTDRRAGLHVEQSALDDARILPRLRRLEIHAGAGRQLDPGPVLAREAGPRAAIRHGVYEDQPDAQQRQPGGSGLPVVRAGRGWHGALPPPAERRTGAHAAGGRAVAGVSFDVAARVRGPGGQLRPRSVVSGDVLPRLRGQRPELRFRAA